MAIQSEISKETQEKIASARFSQEEYHRAMTLLREELGGFPNEPMVNYAARMFAASREHEDVREEIGDHLESSPPWIVIEVYTHLGMF